MDAAAELGRNPISKHQIQPEYGDEEADARRHCRTPLVRPNSQARTWTGINFSCSAHHEQDWQPCPVDPYSCYMRDHTCRRPDSRMCFFFFSFCFFRDVAFSEYFLNRCRFLILWRVRLVRFSLPNGVFYRVTTAWIFSHQPT